MSHKFSKNSKYYTIALYSIAVIIISAIIVKVIFNWDSTSTAFSNVINILYPFILGLLIAYLINPFVKFIHDKLFGLVFKNKNKAKGAKKIFSIILAYMIVIGFIVTCLFYIIPQITDSLKQISTLVNSAQSGYNQLMEKLLEMESKHPEWDLTIVNDTIQDIPNKLMDFITEALPELIPTIYSTSMSVISGVLNALIAIMVSIYMLIDKQMLLNSAKKIIYALFGAKNGDKVLNTAFECNKIFSGFVLGKMIDSLIIGILCFIIMSVIKLPYALMISVIVGVTNMIPYFGPFIGAVPGVLLLLFADLKYAFIFIILIIVLQQFDGLFLGPKILGDSTGLRPLWIIFAITVGGSVAGVLGMFLGVPTLAVFAYIINIILEKRLNQKRILFFTDSDSGVMSRISDDEEIIAIQKESSDKEEASDKKEISKTKRMKAIIKQTILSKGKHIKTVFHNKKTSENKPTKSTDKQEETTENKVIKAVSASAEIFDNTEIPHSNEIPHNTEIPHSNEIPRNTEMPHSNEFPHSNEILHSNELSNNTEIPHSNEIPHNTEIPNSKWMPHTSAERADIKPLETSNHSAQTNESEEIHDKN